MESEKKTSISAHEEYVKDIFSEKYVFEIPDFQRPFAWNLEHFQQLFGDIKEAININQDQVGNDFSKYDPYFLGSLIIWATELKDDKSGSYKVIDGQQRLTSLTILMAVLRDITDNGDYKRDLQSCIYQKESKAKGTKESVRITIREQNFFKTNVLVPNGTQKSNSISKDNLTESQKHIIEAITFFTNAFLNAEEQKYDYDFIDIFIQYLLQKVILVIVQTGSLSSAFRLFNVINTRGLSLTNADILKSENLRVIDDEKERELYRKRWEEIEEDIGTENLEMIIGFVRSLILKEKAKKAIYEEFAQKIYKNEPDFKGKKFFAFLEEIYNIYNTKIVEGQLSDENKQEDVYFFNLISLMRNFLPFNDWMLALISFNQKYHNNHLSFSFLAKFERKIIVDWVIGLTFAERQYQIFRILKIIEQSKKPDDVLNDPLLTTDVESNSRKKFEDELDENNFYGRASGKIPKYILLRLDQHQFDNLNKKFNYTGEITIEHILPKTPKDAYWLTRFLEIERLENTNKLGNLTLLNGRKNPAAGNKPFLQKLEEYFKKRSDFKVTEKIGQYSDWNMTNLNKRHGELKSEIVKIWF